MSGSNPLPPDEMSDEELHAAYQAAKRNGPVDRVDRLQLEIAERWEDQVERADDHNFTVEGKFAPDTFTLSAYEAASPSLVEEVWFTWSEIEDRNSNHQIDFTFNL